MFFYRVFFGIGMFFSTYVEAENEKAMFQGLNRQAARLRCRSCLVRVQSTHLR